MLFFISFKKVLSPDAMFWPNSTAWCVDAVPPHVVMLKVAGGSPAAGSSVCYEQPPTTPQVVQLHAKSTATMICLQLLRERAF